MSSFLYGQDTLTVDRLDYRFLSYKDGILEPIASLENEDVAGVFVPCEDNVFIEVCGPKPFDIWVDGRLVVQEPLGDCQYLEMKSLCQMANRDTVFISLVSRENLKGLTARTFVIRSSKKNPFEIIRRSKVSQFVYFGFVTCFVVLIVMRDNFSGGKITLKKPNLLSFNGKFFSIEMLLIQFVVILMSSFSYVIYRGDASVGDWITIGGYLLLYWCCLIVITWSSATVFRFNRFANWQLIFTVKSWFILSLLVFTIQFISQIFNLTILESEYVLVNTVAVGLLMFMMVIVYIFMLQRGIKSLHIFIYLCTTEILPIGLIIYWLLE